MDYSFKQLNAVQTENSFISASSKNILVEDGGSIKRLSAENKLLPEAQSTDENKVVSVNSSGNYVLMQIPTELPELPAELEDKTYTLELDNGVLSWVEQA